MIEVNSGKWEISSFKKTHVKGRFQLNNTFQGISLFQFLNFPIPPRPFICIQSKVSLEHLSNTDNGLLISASEIKLRLISWQAPVM